MKLAAHEINFESLDALSGVDSLCVFIAEDERPLRGAAAYLDWRMCGGLSRVLKAGFFIGALGDALLLPSNGRVAAERVFAVGLGPSSKLDAQGLATAFATAARTLTKAKAEAVALEVPQVGPAKEETRVEKLGSDFLPGFSGKVVVLGDKAVARRVAESDFRER